MFKEISDVTVGHFSDSLLWCKFSLIFVLKLVSNIQCLWMNIYLKLLVISVGTFKLPLSCLQRAETRGVLTSWTNNRLSFWYPASTTEHKTCSALKRTFRPYLFEKFTFYHICSADKTCLFTLLKRRKCVFFLKCIYASLILYVQLKMGISMSAWAQICQTLHFWPQPYIIQSIKKRLELPAYHGTACYCQPGANFTKKCCIFGWICMQTEKLVFNPVWPQISGRNPFKDAHNNLMKTIVQMQPVTM